MDKTTARVLVTVSVWLGPALACWVTGDYFPSWAFIASGIITYDMWAL